MRERPVIYGSRQIPGSSLAWILAALVFLWPVMEASACPICTRNRMLQHFWDFKMFGILVLAPILVTFTRLDFVRVLFVFIPLSVLNIKLCLLLTWYEHPGTLGILAGISSLLAPVMIVVMGRISFFCKDGKTGFLIWQPVAYFGLVMAATRFIRF